MSDELIIFICISVCCELYSCDGITLLWSTVMWKIWLVKFSVFIIWCTLKSVYLWAG